MSRILVSLVFFSVIFTSPAGAADATEKLQTLFDSTWEREMQESPIWASMLGDRRFNDQLPDRSFDAIEKSHAADKRTLKKLKKIKRDALSPEDQLNYDLFAREFEERIEAHQYRNFLIPLNQRGGIQTAHQVAERLRFTTEKDYEDWVTRLNRFGVYVEQTTALMKQGMAEGRVQPKIVMERVPRQIARQHVDDPAESPFFEPFKKMPESFSDATRDRLTKAALAAISDTVLPAYKKFDAFFNEEYLPACRDDVGAWSLPNGQDFYAYRVASYTTTDLTADEIHEIGKREVARIRAEMMKIIDSVGYEGSFGEFLEFLRTDPQFYYDNADDLLEAYRATSKRIDPELVKLFGKLPRMPYGVKPIPMDIAPDTTTAYYSSPAADGSRAGIYWVNLYKPETRPKYEIEVLSVHEAMPGHHLQLSIAQELGELPNFRRYGGFTAFVEGWGLYSESLGGDLGLYQDPYSKFGQLTYEMWRAVRLVVDTGMHHKKWTREQAIEFFKENAAKTEHDIVNEIDRYIAWPGQALAYKIGELKIKELRARAEETLGDQFDIRGFHDVVLGSGAVPLDVLERQVDDWISARSS